MSEPAAKRPMIDLDEFERRLRRPTPAAVQPHDDPLAELARLVGGVQEDPFKNVFEQDRHLPRAPRMASAQGGAARVVQAAPRVQEAAPRTHDAAPRVQPAPRVQEDFGAADYAAHDQHLHGTIHPQDYAEQEYADPNYGGYGHEDPALMAAQAGYRSAPAEDQDYAWSEVEAPVAAAPVRSPMADAPRSRRPLYVMFAIIAAGIAGIGVSFAYKAKSGPHELAMIKAMSGPTKVQPDSPGGADVANQDASILDKTPQPTPVALVDHQERPVDLAHQQPAPRTIMADAAGSMGAASVPVPPPPAGGQGAGAQQNIQSYGIGALIEPKKVKTIAVSVGADGRVLPNDTPPQMPLNAPGTPSAQAQHPASPAATGAATPKPATPKSTARVVTTPKPQTIEQAADDNGEAPAAAAPAPTSAKPAPAKPMKVAEAETTDSIPDAEDTHGSGGGSFAIQLAAPATEQEAHDMTNKLASKFGSALGGHHLTYHRAKVNDKTVFRIRAAGLSPSEAAAICGKVKAAGGDCYPTKN